MTDIPALMSKMILAMDASMHEGWMPLYVPRKIYDQDPELADKVAREYGFQGAVPVDPMPRA